MTWGASPAILVIVNTKGSDWTEDQRAEVLKWLTETHYRRLVGWSVYSLPAAQKDQANDALHDFLLQIEKPMRQYDPSLGQFDSYLVGCLRTFILNWKRARSRRPGLALIDNRGQKPDIGDPFLRREIDDCFDRQPPDKRKALRMLLEEYQPAEIAQELGVTKVHARVIIHRARLMLKDCLKAKGIDSTREKAIGEKNGV